MVLRLKIALILLSVVLSAIALLPGVRDSVKSPKWPFLVHGYFILRLAFLVVAVHWLHFAYPKWNVPFYFSEGVRVLEGQLPDRDFFHPYSPLFPYFLAAALAIWKNLFTILIVFQFVEWMAVTLLVSGVGPELGMPTFLLYAVNPVTLVYFWLGAEQTAFVLLALALALYWKKPLANGIAAGFGMMISKVLTLWFLIPLLLARGWTMRFAFIGTCAVIALPFFLMGSSVMSSKITNPDGTLQDQSTLSTAGSIWEFIPASHDVCRLAVIAMLGLTTLLVTWRHMSFHGFGENPVEEDAQTFVAISAVCFIFTFQVFFQDIVADYVCPATWIIPLLFFRRVIKSGDLGLFIAVSAFQTLSELLMYHSPEFAGHGGFYPALFGLARHANPLLALALLLRFYYLLLHYRPSRADNVGQNSYQK